LRGRGFQSLVAEGEMHLTLFFLQTEHEDQDWGSEGCDWAVTVRDQMLQGHNCLSDSA
jgi:hypothetical protein